MIEAKDADPRIEAAYDAAMRRAEGYDYHDGTDAEMHAAEIVQRYAAEDYTAAEALAALAKV